MTERERESECVCVAGRESYEFVPKKGWKSMAYDPEHTHLFQRKVSASKRGKGPKKAYWRKGREELS